MKKIKKYGFIFSVLIILIAIIALLIKSNSFQQTPFFRILIAAIVDAVNPCEFAVLTMVLVSILIANPENKKRVLYSGLAFSLAIFIGYLVYGLVIIEIFKGFEMFSRVISGYVTKAIAILSIFLGIFNVKDFLNYKPGGFATEMPLKLRPLAKAYIKKITSPRGAFIIGFLVTLFLVPCTMGPYLIALEILSNLSFIQTIPWLILYNFIFIFPMIAITFIVYLGLSSTEDLTKWKEQKIKYIHLIAGILLIGLGIGILTGIIY
jgi:cytochrome c biogenesis protein CcdA